MKHFYILKKQNIINALVIILFIAGFFVGITLNIPPCLCLAENSLLQNRSNSPFSPLKIIASAAPVRHTIPQKKEEQKYFTAEEGTEVTIKNQNANSIQIDNDSGYNINVNELLSTPLKPLSKSVLILHTHTGEAYTPSQGYEYVASDSYRTQDNAHNMIAIGSVMEKTLKSGGIDVTHNKTVHDYPSYSGSYERSLESAQQEIAKNPKIGIVLDIHRDAIGGDEGYLKPVCEINGEKCAQVLLVVGTDASGLYNPNWQRNLRAALSLQEIMNKKYPNLARPIGVRKERFNSHLSDCALLIEIGANGNTQKEAELCARLVAESLVELILNT